jgi:hypothetical protein
MKRKAQITWLFAFVAIVAAVLGGCGGSSSEAEASLTKQQFLARAQAICEASEREQLKNGVEYLNKHPGIEEEEIVVPVGLPPLQKQVDQIEALPPPQADRPQVEEITAAFEKAIKHAEADPGSVVTETPNPFGKADRLAAGYGLAACSHAP